MKTIIVLAALAAAVMPATAQSNCVSIPRGNVILTQCEGPRGPVNCVTYVVGNVTQTVCQ